MAPDSPAEIAKHELSALPPPDSVRDKEKAESSNDLLYSNFPGRDHVILLYGRRSWVLPEGWRLENNLLWGVGLLELANAGDFAANIWNDVPVPLHAVILMAIGGTVAGVICVFAFLDSVKARHNINFLQHQRAELRAVQASRLDDVQPSQSSIEVLDQLTKRELRTETISRWCMDILMGVGAVLIAIGTFMAIGGANHTVWFVSNILSGYLGNAPIALFGVINASWQGIVWRRMHHHKKAAAKHLNGDASLTLIRKRCHYVQLYSVVNGSATILGGVASMLTPTWWWAYVILIPVIVSSYFCNFWLRKKIGYDRPHIDTGVSLDASCIIFELCLAVRLKRIVEDHPDAALAHLVPDRETPDSLLAFLISHGLFETFCLRLINDKRICPPRDQSKALQLNFDREILLALHDVHTSAFWKVADELLRIDGRKHFRHRQRFFTELLGEFYATTS